MGIPSFYKWLTEKYPDIVVDVVEERRRTVNGVLLPIDTSRRNPNRIEFDNLYLDMNGIIHPCFHPSGLPPPKSYDEVFGNVFMYIDRIFSIVRPRKLLFLGIDGVAPRAKMNQQRSRRFRAAKEAEKEALKREKLRKLGAKSTSLEEPAILDSNVITPGTEFMELLSSALRYYIQLRINTESGWRRIKVILSDSNVPGEGEHKIMSFIRLQRDLPGYDPNTRHCLYGLDADLIMLALATHEVHFTILREEMLNGRVVMKNFHKGRKNNSFVNKGKKHTPSNLQKKNANVKKKKKPLAKNVEQFVSRMNFKFLKVWALREYINYDMTISDSTLQTDLERLIDDFILICLFVGNDFLPHSPTLEISEGAIDLLMMVYKKEFLQMGGYLTNSFEIDLKRMEHFIQAVGLHDKTIYMTRVQKLKEKSARRKGQFSKRKFEKFLENDSNAQSTADGSSPMMEKKLEKLLENDLNVQSIDGGYSLMMEKKLGELLENDPIVQSMDDGSPTMMEKKLDKLLENDTNAQSIGDGSSLMMEKATGMNSEEPVYPSSDDTDTADDKIQVGESDWKEIYYAKKFKAKTKDEQESIRAHVVFKYMEGICWVMRYYYEGVCSWQWFYPYHYAPFSSDFYGLDQLKIQFTIGEPFKPLDQLMSVLPAASAHALPISYRKLMTDVSSPILDFYPSDFELDMNGKRRTWQAICKLPFIEESRLLSEITKVEHTLMDCERRRNSLGSNILFVHISHPLANMIMCYSKQNCDPNMLQAIDPKLSGGMNGFVCISDKAVWPEEIYSPIDGMQMIAHNRVISVSYRYPLFHYHISRLPEGVILPSKDISPPRLLHGTVVSRGIFPKRPIPKSGLGPHLTDLAHQLVSSSNHTKQDDTQGNKGPNFHADPSNLGGINTQVNSRKRKQMDNKITFDDVCHGRKRTEGEHIPQTLKQQNLKQCVSCEQRDGNCNAGVVNCKHGDGNCNVDAVNCKQGDGNCNSDAVKEMKNETKSAKRKRKKERKRLKKMQESEGFGVPDKNVVQLDHCIRRNRNQSEGNDNENIGSCTDFERPEVCSISEKRQSDDAHRGTPGTLETKTLVESKKRKRRSVKRKQTEVDDSHASREPRGTAAGFVESIGDVSSNNVEKGSSLVGAENGTPEKLENNVYERQGDDAPADAPGIMEIKTQVKSKKRKRRSGKQKQLEVDNHASKEQGGSAAGFVESISDVPSNNIEEFNSLGGAENCSLQQLENDVRKEQGTDALMGAPRMLEIKTQVKSKKRKKKSSKRKQMELDAGHSSKEQGGSVTAFMKSTTDVPSDVEKLRGLSSAEKGILEELENDVCKKQGESCVVHLGTNGLVTDGPEVGAQVRSKSKKRKLKGKSVLNSSLEKLESVSLSMCDSNLVDANGLVVQSDGKKHREFDGIGDNLEEERSIVIGKQVCGDHDHTCPGAAAEMKMEVKSREEETELLEKD